MNTIQNEVKNKITSYNSIMFIQWHLTDLCEEKCSHCYLTERKGDLSVSENKKIIDKLVIQSKCIGKPLFIAFTGGDPLLYSGIFELINYCSEKGVFVTIKGNPHCLITKSENIDKLKEAKVLSYQLSLDGTQATHDSIRSQGNYDRTLLALKKLVDNGITTVVKMTVSNENVNQLTDVMQIVDDIGVDFIGISRMVCIGGAQTNHCALNMDTWQRTMQIYDTEPLRHTMKIFYDPLWIPYFIETKKISFNEILEFVPRQASAGIIEGCTIWEDSYSLHPNGDVYACSRIPDSWLGNLRNSTFENIENRIAEYREVDKLACIPCRYVQLCRGCRAVAKAMTGDYYGLDYCCWINQNNK